MKKNKKADQRYFFKEAKEIIEKHNPQVEEDEKGLHYIATVDTIFGKLQVSLFEENEFCFSVYMRFAEHDKFSLDEFYKFFSKYENINRYSLKWNIMMYQAEDTLCGLEERLDNLKWIEDKANYNLVLTEN